MRNSIDDPLHPFESELLEELFAAQRRLAPGVARARPPHVTHKRVALVGGCAAIAVGAGVVAGSLASRGPGGSTAVPSATKITAQLVDALQTSSTDVLYDQEVQSTPGVTLTLHEWVSPWDPSPGQTVSERIEFFQDCTGLSGCTDSGLVQDFGQTGTMPAGATVFDEFPWGTSVTTAGEAVDVDYHDRQWVDQKSAQVSFNLPLTAADIQQEIAAGNARVVGNATVDGVQTVELAISGFDGPGSSGDIWVDASSHLPVRTVVTAPNPGTGQGAPGGMQTVQDDYQFLPATSANLAKLHPVIPSGFTENRALDPDPSNGS
ncbi:MAG TPA: hypothetical protein VND62_05005 [Acidimicrobiales bacterium]|nr:hypothetical protein [Acidimicrobiales bacterium]